MALHRSLATQLKKLATVTRTLGRRTLRRNAIFGCIERITNGEIHGWLSCGDQGRPFVIRDGANFPVDEIEWFEREDVQDHYPDLPLKTGFALTIPTDFWRRDQAALLANLMASCDSVPLTVSDALREELGDLAARQSALRMPHGEAAADDDRQSPAIWQSGLTLMIGDPGLAGSGPLDLRFGGQNFGVQMFQSRDAARQIIEIPPWIWGDADEDGSIEVELLCADQPVAKTLVLVKEATHSFEYLRYRPTSDVAEFLVHIEHARFLLNRTTLPEDTRQMLFQVAGQFRCLDFMLEHVPDMAQDGWVPSFDAPEERIRFFKAQDALKMLLQDGDPVTLELVMDTLKPFDLAEWQETDAIISFATRFCETGNFDVIAGVPTEQKINRMSRNKDSNVATIAMLLLVVKNRIGQAASVLENLEDIFGWVNSACLKEVSGRVARSDFGSEDVVAFANALFDYFEEISGFYWSRLHDRNLATSLVPWLERLEGLPTPLADQLEAVTLRSVSLSRDFWQAWSTPLDASPRSHRLNTARRQFHELDDLLTSRMTADQLCRAIELAHEFQNYNHPDADLILRDLTIYATTVLPDTPQVAQAVAKGLQDQPETEALRLMAHPCYATSEAPLDHEGITGAIRKASERPNLLFRSPVLAEQETCGRLVARLRKGDVLTGAELAQLVDTSLALNSAEGGWLTSDTLLRAADSFAPESSEHAMLSRTALDAFEAALAQGANAIRFPALQAADARFQALGTPPLTDPGKRADLGFEGLQPKILSRGHPDIPGNGDTLVVIYSCQPNLENRIPALRDTWIADLQARGIPYIVITGDGDDTIEGDVLRLDVPDGYEELPAKSMKMVDWVYRNTSYQYLFKIDDDCYFSFERYFDMLSHRKFHYHGRILYRDVGHTLRTWHHPKSDETTTYQRLDRSPEPSLYCDGSTGYSLSRLAMATILQMADSQQGQRLIHRSFFEDKLIGDMLALDMIYPSNEDFLVHILRKTAAGQDPVVMYQNNFHPSRVSPVSVAHLDATARMQEFHERMATDTMTPHRIWPTHSTARLGYNANQLNYASEPLKLERVKEADIVLVAVLRNEMDTLPSFLAHYRALGVRAFLLADNLSNDGTREYLLAQDDVALYSVDTEYRASHFGVDWQQALLANHCFGKWAVVVDADEFLTFEGIVDRTLADITTNLDKHGYDCVPAALIDMYPQGPLSECNLADGSPFELAGFHDDPPVLRAPGGGRFSNTREHFTSSLRHRIMPNSQASLFAANKFPLLRYSSLMRLSEGLHFLGNVRMAPDQMTLAHFKYHAGFAAKVEEELKRKQHFAGGIEYVKYHAMLQKTGGRLYEEGVSTPLSATLRPHPSWIHRVT